MTNFFKRNKDMLLISALALSAFVSEGIGIYHARKAVTAETPAAREEHKYKGNVFVLAGAGLFTVAMGMTAYKIKSVFSKPSNALAPGV